MKVLLYLVSVTFKVWAFLEFYQLHLVYTIRTHVILHSLRLRNLYINEKKFTIRFEIWVTVLIEAHLSWVVHTLVHFIWLFLFVFCFCRVLFFMFFIYLVKYGLRWKTRETAFRIFLFNICCILTILNQACNWSQNHGNLSLRENSYN